MRSELPIEDAVEVILDHRGRTPKKLGSSFGSDGVQVISAQNITQNRLDLGASANFVDEVTADRWMPNPLRPGDVLLSSEAPLGCVALVGESHGRLCLGQRLFALRPRRGIVDSTYLAAALKSEPVRQQLLARASGTTAQGIKQAELRKVALPLPSISEQRAIAFVISSLDDKIESNRRLAALLDETAVELFRARFVDFVGVDEFVDSDLGPIPSGWSVKRIDELAEINSKSLTAKRHPDRILYIDISSVSPGTINEIRELGFDEAPSRARRVVESGDTIVSTVRPERRAMAFVHEAAPALTASTGFAVVHPVAGAPTMVHRAVTSDACIEHLAMSATGSAYPAVNPAVLSGYLIAVPPDCGAEFEEVARPLEAWQAKLRAESKTLTAIRDELLPKLIAGEIEVQAKDDVKAIVEVLAG